MSPAREKLIQSLEKLQDVLTQTSKDLSVLADRCRQAHDYNETVH